VALLDIPFQKLFGGLLSKNQSILIDL